MCVCVCACALVSRYYAKYGGPPKTQSWPMESGVVVQYVPAYADVPAEFQSSARLDSAVGTFGASVRIVFLQNVLVWKRSNACICSVPLCVWRVVCA